MRTSTDQQNNEAATTGRSAEILKTVGVSAGYGSVRIVHGADIHVDSGEAVCIIGPNGAGKSTLLKALIGVTKMFDGSAYLNGSNITGLRTEQIVRLGVGYVPQAGLVFPNLSVEENLEMGAYTLTRKLRAERIGEVLELFPHLRDLQSRRAELMSGGEQTMLGIARAMLTRPNLLLLDEISSGLAPRVVRQLWDDLRRLRALGIAMLMVEQRTREVLELTDRGYVLVDGKVALEGSAHFLANDVDLGAVFLQGGATRQAGRV
jgi:ABC-type branched-subunit amino acid transport system ATPase component